MMGQLEKRALICGKEGLLTDALNRVFSKEGWLVRQTGTDADTCREMLRLHGADVLLCWLGTNVQRSDIAAWTQALDTVFSEAARQETGSAYLLCSPDSKESADVFALVAEKALAWHHQTSLRVTIVMMPPLYGPALHRMATALRLLFLYGLRQIGPQLIEKEQALAAAEKEQRHHTTLRQAWHTAVPYLENVAGAVLMYGVSLLQGGTITNPQIYFDMNFLYIGTMGLVYGMRQAVIAMILASILLIHMWLGMGRDIVGLLYEPVNLLHLTSYLFVAFLLGYFSDRRRQEKLAAAWQKDLDHEQYQELSGFYEEALRVKDHLYRQIVNSEDSIGRLYHIIEPLDSVDVENIFDQAAQVTAKVLRVENIAIYIPDQAGEYLRSKVRRGPMTDSLPRSLKLDTVSWLHPIWRDKRMFVNRDHPDILQQAMHDHDREVAYYAVSMVTDQLESLVQQIFTMEQAMKKKAPTEEDLRAYAKLLRQYLSKKEFIDPITGSEKLAAYVRVQHELIQYHPQDMNRYLFQLSRMNLFIHWQDIQNPWSIGDQTSQGMPTEDMAADHFLIIYDPEDVGSVYARHHLDEMLKEQKKTADIYAFDQNIETIPPDTRAVLIAMGDLGSLASRNAIADYVEHGGTACQLIRPDAKREPLPQDFLALMGIEEAGEMYRPLGIDLKTDYLLGGKGFHFGEGTTYTSVGRCDDPYDGGIRGAAALGTQRGGGQIHRL